jgi:hemoglobin-like flavoprotein
MLAKAPSDRHRSLRLLVRELEHALPVGTSNLEIAHSSYARCLAEGPFIDLFYETLMKKPEASEAFRGIEMGRQADMLGQALKTIFTMGVDSEQGRDTIRRISRRHARVDLTNLYDTFVETLLATVREQDEECNAQVEEAWRQILNSFIEQLKRAQMQNPPEFV